MTISLKTQPTLLVMNTERKRIDLFWQDCRESLGYDQYLNDEGVNTVESYAWQLGHSSGFAEVYHYLCELVELAETLVKSRK